MASMYSPRCGLFWHVLPGFIFMLSFSPVVERAFEHPELTGEVPAPLRGLCANVTNQIDVDVD